ncbi:MAG TPA: hypothetical protein ENI11_01510 [Actinobacteria bacterium]|nr:hypothetical protein [Actinomycetota bacterium]
MREGIAQVVPWFKSKREHQLKLVEEPGKAIFRENPKLLALMAVGFMFGFGFLIAVGYLVWKLIIKRQHSGRADESAPADELVP